jgi:hypothetical protein
VYACHEELEAVAALREAGASLYEGAYLEGLVAGEVLMEGIEVAAGDGLGGSESCRPEQEDEDPKGRGRDALHALGQSKGLPSFPDVSGCSDRRKPPVNGGRLGSATGFD